MKAPLFVIYILALLGFGLQPVRSVPEDPAQPPAPDAGFGVARTGNNGWYTSEWTVYAVSPVVANGSLLAPGESLTITEDGEHFIEYVSPDGQNTAGQTVRIDRTPPQVNWNTPLNFEVTADHSGLSANFSDSVSGVCQIELSTDSGNTWIEGWNAAGFSLRELVRETTWTYHDGFPDLSPGGHVMIVRARDCAGNLSRGVVQVVRVRDER